MGSAIRRISFVASLACLISGQVLAAAGVSPGSFDTNGNGGAEYVLAVQVPPGTAGVEPAISLAYNSQGGNGLLGYGWSLTGISSIARCAGKIFTDGSAGDVDFTGDDRFCVNGQRLIAVADADGRALESDAERHAAYGQPGTTYRTERETWTIFTAHYGNCEGPCYFTAMTRAGVELSFGATPAARFEAFPDRPVVRSWYIDRSSDTNGNGISYTYFEDVKAGFHRPEAILYTHNDAAGTPALRAVKFEFEDRADHDLNYLGGAPGRTLQRLTEVVTFVDYDADGKDLFAQENLVKRYRIRYEQEVSADFRWLSMVESIRECGPTECLSPTRLGWPRDAKPELVGPNENKSDLVAEGWHCRAEDSTSYWVDFNGDSRTDLACVDAVSLKSAYVAVSNGRELVGAGSDGGEKVGDFSCTSAQGVVNWTDFNGDGMADLACATRGGKVEIHLSDGRKLLRSSAPALDEFSCPKDAQVGWIDFNGDGRFDLYCSEGENGTHTVWVSDGHRLVPANEDGGVVRQDWPCALQSAKAVLHWMDFNGDGRSDLVCSHRAGDGNHYALVSDSKTLVSANDSEIGLVRSGWTCGASGAVFSHNDFNGDGLSDLACNQGAGGGKHWVLLSTGRRFQSPNDDPDGLVLDGWKCPDQLGWTDFNADGNSDLYCSQLKSPGNHRVMLSTGVAMEPAGDTESGIVLEDWTCSVDMPLLRWVDFRGGGRTAPFCSHRSGNGNQYALVQAQARGDLVTAINEGPGKQIDIGYGQLSDADLYTRGAEQSYPYVAVRASPLTVVRSHSVRAHPEAEDVFTYSHRYSDGQLDRTWGWLGFAETRVADPQNVLSTITVHENRFPLLGVIRERRTVDIDDESTVLGISSTGSAWEENNGIYNTWTESSELDHYTNGTFNYTLAKRYTYDDRHRNLIRVAELGDKANPDENYWICLRYPSAGAPGTLAWAASFLPEARKIVNAESACDNMSSWEPETDLRWSRYQYDDRLNRTHNHAWWDTRSRWVGSVQEFSEHGNPVSFTDAGGNKYTQTYDPDFHTFPRRYKTPVPDPGDPDSKALTVQSKYEPAFANKIEARDANGTLTLKVNLPQGMDEFGRITEVHSASPKSEEPVLLTRATFAENELGGLTSTNYHRSSWEQGSPDWIWTAHVVDGLGRKVETRSPGFDEDNLHVQRLGFNDRGLVQRQYLPYFDDGRCRRYEPQGQCLESVDFYEHGYNRHGYPNLLVAPDGGVERVEYRLHDDRKIARILPDPAADAGGDATVTWMSESDSRGRTRSITAPNQGKAGYEYDLLGSMRVGTDPLGVRTEYHHNSLGLVTRMVSGDTGTTTYTYNALRQQKTRSTADGRTVVNHYDALGRITKVESRHESGGGDSEQVETVRFFHDDPKVPFGRGEVTRVSKGDHEIAYGYDRLGHLTKEAIEAPVAGENRRFELQYDYDALGRLTEVVHPGGAISRYRFAPDGNLSKVLYGEEVDNLREYATYSGYNALGAYTASRFANGVVENRRFDLLGRPLRASAEKGALKHFDYRYDWNHASKLRSVTDAVEGGDDRRYKYDHMGYLRQADTADGKSEFHYNLTGDIDRRRDAGAGQSVVFRYPDNSHRLETACLTESDKNTCPDGSEVGHWSYDAYGRIRSVAPAVQSESSHDYRYSASGHLASVSQGETPLTELAYDPLGSRFRKHSQGVTTYYISPYFELLETEGRDLVATNYVQGPNGVIAALSSNLRPAEQGPSAKAAGGTLFSAALALAFAILLIRGTPAGRRVGWLRRFNFLAWIAVCQIAIIPPPVQAALVEGDNGYGNPVAEREAWFVTDYQRSVALVTDASGAETNRVYYEPYGGVSQRSSGADTFRPKFTGKERDEASGLQFFGTRYYDPATGRFQTPDPANQYASPYVYGNDDPLRGFDPDGEFFLLAALAVAAVIGAYAGGAIANHSANPASWDWKSGKTYAGIVTGGAVGVVAVAVGAVALVGAGLVAPEAIAIGGVAAGTIAFGATDVAFLSYDAYQFSQDRSVENGVYLALDLIPFAGLAAKGARLAYRGVEGAVRGTEAVAHGVDAGEHGVAAVDHGVEATAHEGEAGETTVLCAASFVPGTRVATAGASVAIEDIDVGDEVISYREAGGTPERGVVTALFDRRAGELVSVQTETDRLRLTPNHPLLMPDGNWVTAGELRVGMSLQGADGRVSRVVSTGRESHDGRVHNFEVANWHNYAVGSAGVVVHNTTCGKSQRAAKRKASRAIREGSLVEIRKKRRFRRNILPPNRLSPGAPGVPQALPSSGTRYNIYAGRNAGGRIVYIGITEVERGGIAPRAAEHLRDGRVFSGARGGRIELIGRDLPEYAAKGIETAGIEKLWSRSIRENTVRSIKPGRPFYLSAVRFGEEYLKYTGIWYQL